MTLKRPKKVAAYTCEAELCEQLRGVARAVGFKVYAETGGHDLLLIAGADCKGFKEGDQIGIQAKLRENIQVLAQALPAKGIYSQGPHYYAVLVPHASAEFKQVAHAAQISVIAGDSLAPRRFGGRSNYEGGLGEYTMTSDFGRVRWFRQDHMAKPCWVPDCEVDGLKAGVAGPVQITKWKMQAIKLCMVGVERGYLTSRDFKDHGIEMSRWLAKGWIEGYDFIVHEGKRMKRYILRDDAKPPHLLYGVVTDALGKAGLV